MVNVVIWLSTAGTAPRLSAPISAQVQTLGMKVYPNPANDRLHIAFASDVNSSSVISIIDLTGHLVFSSEIAAGNSSDEVVLDLSTIQSGLYVISMQNGKDIVSQRFIKQ